MTLSHVSTYPNLHFICLLCLHLMDNIEQAEERRGTTRAGHWADRVIENGTTSSLPGPRPTWVKG